MDVEQDNGDKELDGRVADGDEAAFAELYGRYFGPIYDFAIRLTRDRNMAALVVQSTFLRTYQRLRGGGPQSPVRLQLFAGAIADARERLRGRRKADAESDEPFAVAEAVPPNVALAAELAGVAWQAAQELRAHDYELLDLSVRHHLDEGELAAIMRTQPQSVQSKLAGARDTFEQSYVALLLLSRGRRECVDLDFMIGGAVWSAALRRRISRHLQSCQTCQATRVRDPGGIEAFASLLPVSAPEGWQGTMLDRLQESASTGAVAAAAASGRGPGDALPKLVGGGIGDWFSQLFGGGGPKWPLFAVLGGALLFVVLVLAALCTVGAFDDDDQVSPTATLTATATGSPTGTRTPTLTPTPTETAIQAAPTATPAPATATPPPPATEPPATPTVPESTPTVAVPTELKKETPPPPTATEAPIATP